MPCLLVTGGAGFIGSAVVRTLLAEGDTRVVNVDKLTYAGNLESLPGAGGHPRYAFEHADVADGPRMRRVLEEHRPDAILHLAAESHVDRSIDAPAEFVRTNVTGTFTLLEEARRYFERLRGAAREGFRFLHVSTDEVFGSAEDGEWFSEASPYRPSSPYSASKASADHLARAWHRTYGLPVLVTHCSNNYGPFQFPDKLVPLVIRKALAGEPLPVYGTGEHVRDWLYVDDHVRALLAVLARGAPGATYCIGGDEAHRNLDVVRRLCALLDELAPDPAGPRERLVRLVQDRPGHDLRYALDASRVRRETGWAPRETFDTGLRRTVRWYLENGGWADRVLSGAYRGERLGLGGGG
ncbi:MAG TPA: dTDP-glucose 4,6-dehydratase [Longimicrobium sp.]|nr:dTDP-glucose 4,6-dehydratase [Longimicrobium sp.]